MRRVDRYLLSEISGPLALGFVSYTFILVMQFLFRSADMIVRRGVSAGVVGKLVALSLPNMVVLTIPMALLFAILVAIGRLASGSELTALRATGISLASLYRPICVLSLLMFALNSGLMLTALPWGNSNVEKLQSEILVSSATRQIEPRVFYEQWEGLVVYVFEIRPDERRWRGVFVADTAPGNNQVTVAERGELRVDEAGERLVLHLENAVVHKVDLEKPEEYHISRHRRLQRYVEGADAAADAERRAEKSLRSMTIPELREVIDTPRQTPIRTRLARVEIHKKFSIPAACVVFALIALPLGFSQGRGGRGSGFALSILLIMAYYMLLNNGEEAARVGKVDAWVGMWLPNVVFALVGIYFLARKNRDRGLLPRRLDGRLGELLWRTGQKARRKPRPSDETATATGASPDAALPHRRRRLRRRDPSERRSADVVVKLPRFRLRFPNTLDRYVMRLFVWVVILVSLSFLTLFAVADFTNLADEIFENDISAGLILDYLKYSSVQTAYELAPIAVLMTTLIVFGLLSRSNEVMAMKALGVSLYRLAIPALVGASAVTIGCILVQNEVLPSSNQKAAQILDQIRGREVVRSYRRADRNWLFGQGRFVYNYLLYDEPRETLHRLQVFEFDDRYRMTRRLYSTAATYLGGDESAWRFEESWKRDFAFAEDGLVTQEFIAYERPVIDRYPETPSYFETEFRPPDAMNFGQLEEYIDELEAAGQAVPELRTELHNKIAYPAIAIVMALVALPFSFRLGRKGALYGMGLGVVLGMVFMGVFAFIRAFGETGALPPMLAIWTPSIAFIVFSAYMFLGVET